MDEKIETKLEELGDKIEAQIDKIEDAAAERFPGVKSAVDGIVDDVEAAAEAFADTMEDIVDDFVGEDDCDDDCCCGHHHEHGEECDCEEIFEIDIDEDDIVGYIYDEDDNEIGFIIIDEDGEEVELFYAEEGEYEYVEVEEPAHAAPAKAKEDEYDLGITREGVAEATSDMNAIYKEGIQVAAELKNTFDDISSGFDFLRKK